MGIPLPVNDDTLVTTATFAQIADVVPDTVRVWRRAGKITPAFITPSGINLYRRADAERVARARRLARTMDPQLIAARARVRSKRASFI